MRPSLWSDDEEYDSLSNHLHGWMMKLHPTMEMVGWWNRGIHHLTMGMVRLWGIHQPTIYMVRWWKERFIIQTSPWSDGEIEGLKYRIHHPTMGMVGWWNVGLLSGWPEVWLAICLVGLLSGRPIDRLAMCPLDNSLVGLVCCCFMPQQQYFIHIVAVMWCMRWGWDRKPEPTLLLTQGIFYLPHHIGMVWEELDFDNAVSYTQRGNEKSAKQRVTAGTGTRTAVLWIT